GVVGVAPDPAFATFTGGGFVTVSIFMQSLVRPVMGLPIVCREMEFYGALNTDQLSLIPYFILSTAQAAGLSYVVFHPLEPLFSAKNDVAHGTQFALGESRSIGVVQYRGRCTLSISLINDIFNLPGDCI